MEQFPKRLRTWRNAGNWSNGAAAARLSALIGRTISVRTFENWIQGRRWPHPLWIDQIEKAISQ